MRCLVTGAAGFIGSHLAERLLADGHEVLGIDAFIDYYARRLKERNVQVLRSWQAFSFVEGNLLDAHLPPLLDGVDCIFHQAAQAGVRSSWGADFSRYVDCNVLATQRLLEAAVTAGTSVRRFVYASSSSVYGDTTTLPLTESLLPRPISPYGVTKLAAEHLCTLYHTNYGLPTVSLRYFTVYGPRQRPDMAFHKFCKAAIERTPISIYGDGLQTRDFTYISDVVEANLLAASSPAAIGAVMNIAGGSRVTVRQVLHLLEEIAGAPFTVSYDKQQRGDVLHTYADTRLAAQLMGYSPAVDLRTGLASEFAYVSALYAHAHERPQVY